MRKRYLPYLLSGLMTIGALGISGSNYVKADETAIDEGVVSEGTDEDMVPTRTVDPIQEEWYKDYDYKLEDGKIRLNDYTGTATEVYVPKTAVIEGVTYQTDISAEKVDSSSGGFYIHSVWGYSYDREGVNINEQVKKITFESGFTFPENSYGLFYGCGYLEEVNFSEVDTSNVINMSCMFSSSSISNINGLDTSSVTDMSSMFSYSRSTSFDLSTFDTSHVLTMAQMFGNCPNLTSLDLSTFDTSSVTNMSAMFDGCNALESIKLGNNTGNVTNMSRMFRGCSSLAGIDVSKFDTSNVTDMSELFSGCSSLNELNLSSFNTNNVKKIREMFWGCKNLSNLNLSSFSIKDITNAYRMLKGCSNLNEIDLSGFDFSKENFEASEELLDDCSNLEIIYTPVNLKTNVELPGTYYDVYGKKYNIIPSKSSKSIKLAKDKNAFDTTGWVKDGKDWYYYVDGEEIEGIILAQGIINRKSNWYISDNGKYNKSFIGIAQATNGKWYFAKDGVIDKTYSGVAQATNGTWYYVKKGVIDRSFSGKLAQATNGNWYYINKGKPTKSFTGKIAQTTDGKWYYCTKGRPDTKFSGKFAYCTNGEWYYVTKGKIDRSFTGIAEATNGKLYYAKNGKIDKSYTGTYQYNGKTYKVVNGVVKQ